MNLLAFRFRKMERGTLDPARTATTESLERLPDDALVLVLQYLDVTSLLTCRLVCKRIGALALHRDAWRRREVGDYERNRSCVCPELRLAPCVRVLSLSFYNRPACRWAAYAWTRCAATKLWLDLQGGAASQYAAAVALICRQEALGRLRSIEVSLHTKKAANVSLLMGTIASTPGLEKLLVRVWDSSLPTSFQDGGTISVPSLRHFECSLCPTLEPYVNLILDGHAATLETVNLSGMDSLPSSMACVSTVPLLARLPKLFKLSCSNIPGVEAVAACDSLRELELTVRTETEHRGAVAGAAALLRRASQLRKVTVDYSPGTPDVRVDVVRALASSGRASVESLEILNCTEDDDWHHFCHLQELISAIPSLPGLRHLHLYVDTMEKLDELVLAITPATAPALRTVDLGLEKGLCGHAWFHRDAFRTLMSKNLLLHLSLDSLPDYCDDESCQACVKDCHEFVREYDGFVFHLFCHDFDKTCPQAHSVKSRHFQWVLP